MKQTKLIMGMPVTIEISDPYAKKTDFQKIFAYFQKIDRKFSTYKKNSEISAINRGEITKNEMSGEMKTVFLLSEKTKKETNGFFDIERNGILDPSGIVKGWAILIASKKLKKMGYKNYYIDAGGDIQAEGLNPKGKKWQIGIKNPFNQSQVVKVVSLTGMGIATSGTYIRGNHIYNPKSKFADSEIMSLSVIGPDIYEADRFATAAFAMGKKGIFFIDGLSSFEGYMIDKEGIATQTRGFESYL